MISHHFTASILFKQITEHHIIGILMNTEIKQPDEIHRREKIVRSPLLHLGLYAIRRIEYGPVIDAGLALYLKFNQETGTIGIVHSISTRLSIFPG